MNQCKYLKKIDDNNYIENNNYIEKYLKRSMIINDDNNYIENNK